MNRLFKDGNDFKANTVCLNYIIKEGSYIFKIIPIQIKVG